MSVESMARALNHSKASGTARLVLIGIANHDGDGGAWPTIATLARYANVSERSVQRAIRELVELGEVVVHANDGGNHKTRDDRRPNRYEITLSDGATLLSPRPDHGVTPTVERGDTGDADGVTLLSPEPSKNLPEPSEGGGDAAAPNAQTLVGEWIDHCPQRPPGRVVGQVAREVGAMLAEGIPYETVRAGLAEWHRKALHPSTIASVVHEVMNPPRRGTTADRVSQGMDVARQLAAREGTVLPAIGATG